MKKSREETAKTRAKIIQIAAREFRKRGLHETGVADVMAAAGLTQGGFYRHFDSKDHLVAEACGASMQQLVESAKAAVQSGNDAFLRHVEKFLSNEHCQDMLNGCPIVFVGSELARADIETKKAVSKGYRDLVETISNDARYKDSPAARAEAIFVLSAMIGAVTIARIADDAKLSSLILEETKKAFNFASSQHRAEGKTNSRDFAVEMKPFKMGSLQAQRS